MTATVDAPQVSIDRRQQRRRAALQRRATTIGIGVGLVILWDLLVRLGVVKEIILPFPHEVAIELWRMLGDAVFWWHLWVTTAETLAGFGIGVVVGFGLGAVLGMSRRTREVLFPYVVGFQGLPKVVLAPLFVTAFGFGMMSKIAMATVLAFFPVLLNTMVSLMQTDSEQLRLMRSYGSTGWQTFIKLRLPSAAPMVFAGIKTSLTFALIGAIVGEFVGAAQGLGYLLNLYSYQLRVAEVWAIMVVLALLGVLLYLIIEKIDNKVIFWETRKDDPTPTA